MSRPSDSYALGAQAALRTVKLAESRFLSPYPWEWVTRRPLAELAQRVPPSPEASRLGYALLGGLGLYGIAQIPGNYRDRQDAAEYNRPVYPDVPLALYDRPII